jgi:hypothetical protein
VDSFLGVPLRIAANASVFFFSIRPPHVDFVKNPNFYLSARGKVINAFRRKSSESFSSLLQVLKIKSAIEGGTAGYIIVDQGMCFIPRPLRPALLVTRLVSRRKLRKCVSLVVTQVSHDTLSAYIPH